MFGEYAGVLAATIPGREKDWNDPGVVAEGIDVATGQPNTTSITAEEYYHNLFGYTERYVYDASYVKLRELRHSYNLPAILANRNCGAHAATIAFPGRSRTMGAEVPNINRQLTYMSTTQ